METPSIISGGDVLPQTTVRIRAGDANDPGIMHLGTGYLYNIESTSGTLPLVVSNRHVLCGKSWISLDMRICGRDGLPLLDRTLPIHLDASEAIVIAHPDDNVDLAVVCLAHFVQRVEEAGRFAYWPRGQESFDLDSDTLRHISVTEAIFMVGYPNGIYDDVHGLPIIRRGTLATPYQVDFKGKKEFVVDVAAFPGSSGSPIFAVRERVDPTAGRGAWHRETHLTLLGFLSSGFTISLDGKIGSQPIPTSDAYGAGAQMLHLGICVKANRLEEIVNFIKSNPDQALA